MEQILELGIPLGTALVTLGVTWGMVQKSVSNLQDDNETIRAEMTATRDHFVPLQQYKETTRRLQDQVSEIQRDIKSILMLLRNNGDTRKNRKADS